MAEWNIAPPPAYPSLVAGAMRNAQYAPAPAAPDFDANVAAARAEAAHIEMLRGWRMLAARGHEGAQAVVVHPQVQAKLGPPVPLAAFKPMPPAPALPSVTASVPQAPRAVVPTAPQPTPALAGISRRTEVLSSLLGRPAPVAPPDKLV
jgi:hypothetical protein